MEYWLAWFGQGHAHTQEIAKAAERLGFTGVALPDHVAIGKNYGSAHPSGRKAIFHDTKYPDPMITIATMAAVTTCLRFMTYVYVLPMREPFTVAKQVGTLAAQSQNRFAFGVGAGWNLEEIELLGQDPHTRGRRMDEMLEIIRALWETGVTEYHGEFYDFGPTGQFPLPGARIPIWVGGSTDAALRRAACHDGWLGLNQPIEEVRSLLQTLREKRRHYLESGDRAEANFQTMILPDHVYSEDVYPRLQDLGVSGAIVRVWDTESDTYDSLEAKLEALHQFAARFCRCGN
jgi:probable F420-dependent oxidoreductase